MEFVPFYASHLLWHVLPCPLQSGRPWQFCHREDPISWYFLENQRYAWYLRTRSTQGIWPLPSLPKGRPHLLILPGEPTICREFKRKGITGVQIHRPEGQRSHGQRQQYWLTPDTITWPKAKSSSSPSENKATWHHQNTVFPQQQTLDTLSHWKSKSWI